MPAETCESIDDVIDRLDAVIAQSRRRESRLGYFAVLYRNVTVRVKEGIAAGRFEESERMEQLDVRFARRYFDAYDAFADGRRPTHCWHVAFESAALWRPIILQHLLVGTNAHINLDLGVAAARTCPGRSILRLERDFREINAVLIEMLEDVQHRLGAVSPWIGLLDAAGGTTDELIARTGLTGTRDWAWLTALRLAPLDSVAQERIIARIDERIAGVGRRLLNPSRWFASIALLIRLAERRSVAYVMDALRL